MAGNSLTVRESRSILRLGHTRSMRRVMCLHDCLGMPPTSAVAEMLLMRMTDLSPCPDVQDLVASLGEPLDLGSDSVSLDMGPTSRTDPSQAVSILSCPRLSYLHAA